MMQHYKNTNLEDLPNEYWVSAFGFDGSYEVSNLGRLKSVERYVQHGRGQILIKVKIRKQSIIKDGRLACNLHQDGTRYSINLAELFYQSFHPKQTWDTKTHCIMHVNKCKQDNRMVNLQLISISLSHKVNYAKGLLPQLDKNRIKLRDDYAKLTHKTCKICETKKKITLFEKHRNICLECFKIYNHNKYIGRKAKQKYS